MRMNCILVSPGSIASAYKGRTELACKILFERAEKHAPCLIFFDEAEAIFGKRETGDHSSERKSTLLTYFTTSQHKICCLAATNLPWNMDESFMRRFGTKIYVPLPSVEDIDELVQHLMKTVSLKHISYSNDINTAKISEQLNLRKYSNSDICTLFQKISQIALSNSPLGALLLEDHRTGRISEIPETMDIVVTEEVIVDCIEGFRGHSPPSDDVLKKYTQGKWLGH